MSLHVPVVEWGVQQLLPVVVCVVEMGWSEFGVTLSIQHFFADLLAHCVHCVALSYSVLISLQQSSHPM